MRSSASLGRAERASIIDHEVMSSRVDALGVGYYQLAVVIAIGCFALAECMQMGAVSSLHAAIGRAFHLTSASRAWLVAITYVGEGLGTAVAGPMCDMMGRKTALLTSNILAILTMVATGRLPLFAPLGLLYALRFFNGFAIGLGIVAACVLAVESCPTSFRARLMFAVAFLGSCGYLLSAIGLHTYMPHFGDEPTDRWRPFCLFMSLPAVLSLCCVAYLCESPSFLAVTGDVGKTRAALNHIARLNGHAPVGQIELSQSSSSVAMQQDRYENGATSERGFMDTARFVLMVIAFHATTLFLLSLIDGCRSFFVSGFSYILKDIFAGAEVGSAMSATMLNIVASLAPLIGIAMAQSFLWIGVRRVVLVSALVSACSLAGLMMESVRSMPMALLALVMTAKLSFGPLATAICLIKAESFPTEVRASAFAFITIFAKVACTSAPILVEVLKDAAEGWTANNLSEYICALACAVLTCGVLAIFVPGTGGDGTELEDFVVTASPGAKRDSLVSKNKGLEASTKLSAAVDGYGSTGGSVK